MDTYEKLMCCADAVRRATDFTPDIALVLGSGLGGLADALDTEAAVPYGAIDGFPVSTVPGHAGRFLFGRLGGKRVVVLQGRIHYYEGYPMEDVVLPVRLAGVLGAKTLFLTGAAGGINAAFAPGDLMLLTGHISSFVPSPLRGANIDALGPRFPDMTDAYDKDLRALVRAAAAENGIALREGVYVQTAGPQYETPAEIRMYRALGADAVGMSTACETAAARHMGLRVVAVSCISNMAAGMLDRPLTHQEVQDTADRIGPVFARLIAAAVARM